MHTTMLAARAHGACRHLLLLPVGGRRLALVLRPCCSSSTTTRSTSSSSIPSSSSSSGSGSGSSSSSSSSGSSSSGSSSSSAAASSSSCTTPGNSPPAAKPPPAAAAAAVPVDDDDWLQRSRLLVGTDGLAALARTRVLLVGLGGVGSFVAEFLARAGLGHLTLLDGDVVDTTNRNRQLPALASTVGLPKAAVVAARLRDINPTMQLTVRQEFLEPGAAAALVAAQRYDYVIDAIDSVAPKTALLLAGLASGAHVVSSMGAGGRLDPGRVRLADIADTHDDALAAVVRRRLRKAGVSSGLTVVFSDEPARPASLALTQAAYKRSYFGTASYIPALFGLLIASHVIRHALGDGYRPPRPQQAGSSSKRRRPSGSGGVGGSASSSSSSSNSCGKKPSQPAVAGEQALGGSNSSAAPTLPGAAPPGGAAARGSPADPLLASFDRSLGIGAGFDGDGI